MGPRKYPSGHEKRKKKQKIEVLNQSQAGAIHKFFIPTKQVESSDGNLVNVEDENLVNEEEDHDNLNESDDGNSTKNEDLNIEVEPQNIDDPINWDKIDQNLRDLLVERGPIRREGVVFPKDDSDRHRHFSLVHYTRHLPNGEKYDRKWLVYSEALDRIFCFCCKLFKQEGNKTQLATEGFKD